MGHLVDYEQAVTDREKALAALIVAERKSAKYLAWQWAERAARHAEDCGVKDAAHLLGDGRYPDVAKLRKVIERRGHTDRLAAGPVSDSEVSG